MSSTRSSTIGLIATRVGVDGMGIMVLDTLTVVMTVLLLLTAAGCLAEWIAHR